MILTKKELEPYKEFHHLRDISDQDRLEHQREKAWKAVEKAVQILKDRGATRIILFGSLVDGDFHLHSDIDIACEGLKHDHYFATLGKLLGNLDFSVDLVDTKNAGTPLINRIGRGKILYEKEPDPHTDF